MTVDNDAKSVSVNVDESASNKFDVIVTKGMTSNLEDHAVKLMREDQSAAAKKGIGGNSGLITVSENELRKMRESIEEDKERVEERLTALRKRYETEFSAMQKSLSALKQSEKTIKSFVDSQKPKSD